MRRLLVVCLIGLFSGVACYQYQIAFGQDAGDLKWPLCGARALLAGSDPYDCRVIMSTGQPGPTNPLTAALVVMPFAWLRPPLAAGLCFGLSSALLAAGLLRKGEWWRLLVFLAMPYWAAMQVAQWAPLVFACCLFPALLPLSLAKPHLGIAVLLPRLTWRNVLACGTFGVVSLLIDPTWPMRWLPQTSSYDGVSPLVVMPFGPLLLLALVQWRDQGARQLLALALVPQRLFYDQFLLWLIPRNARQVLLLTVMSWIGYLLSFFVFGINQGFMLAMLYLPTLAMVMWPRISAVVTSGPQSTCGEAPA
jgi:hypothetical protein